MGFTDFKSAGRLPSPSAEGSTPSHSRQTLCASLRLMPIPCSSLGIVALREAWRQFLHTGVAPVALSVSQELADKLEVPDLKLSHDRMIANDLSGRARAFQSMVGGGMEVAKAAALAGLMEPE